LAGRVDARFVQDPHVWSIARRILRRIGDM
jgi:hypothetical protein